MIVVKIDNLKEDYEFDCVFISVLVCFVFPGLSLSKD